MSDAASVTPNNEQNASVQSYLLDADAFCCEIDDGAIFLKLSTHKYYGVDSQHVTALRRAVSGWAPAAVDDCDIDGDVTAALAQLLDRGFLTTHAATGREASPPIARALDSFTVPPGSQSGVAQIPDIARFVYAFCRARRDLNKGRFKKIVTRLQRRHATPGVSDAPSFAGKPVLQLVAKFRRLRPWLYSSRNACLLDSITLIEFLSYYGVVAALVIGVNTKPFGAHAWVQLGSVVINDTVEHVNEYTPILMAPS